MTTQEMFSKKNKLTDKCGLLTKINTELRVEVASVETLKTRARIREADIKEREAKFATLEEVMLADYNKLKAGVKAKEHELWVKEHQLDRAIKEHNRKPKEVIPKDADTIKLEQKLNAEITRYKQLIKDGFKRSDAAKQEDNYKKQLGVFLRDNEKLRAEVRELSSALSDLINARKTVNNKRKEKQTKKQTIAIANDSSSTQEVFNQCADIAASTIILPIINSEVKQCQATP